MEQTESLVSIFDNAAAIEFNKEQHLVAVWNGSKTFNSYNTETLEEIEAFSLSDENGEPVDHEEAAEHLKEHLAEIAH